MTSRSVIVVGAGIAGLTAAYRLQQAGMAVTVLEAQSHIGGRMAELRHGDIVYNTGARLIYPFGRTLMGLIAELDLTSALVPVKGLSADCESTASTYRITLMPSPKTLATPGLSLPDRLRLLAFSAHALSLRMRVDPDDFTSASFCDDTTLADYCDRRMGPRARRMLIDPLFRGTRSWNPEDISSAFLMSTLPQMFFRDTVYGLKGGMGRLTAALAEQLDVRDGVKAVSIDMSRPGFCRVEALKDGRTITLDADVVICAVEGAAAGTLLADKTSTEATFFDHVRYNSLGVVHYAVTGDIAPAMRFARRDKPTLLSTYQQLPASPQQGRPKAQVYCQLTPEATSAASTEGSLASLEQRVRADVRQYLPDIDQRIADSFVQWIEHKLPIPYPGFAAKVTAFREWQRHERRRVYFCGDYLAQALVTGACASGAEAADVVMRHWASA